MEIDKSTAHQSDALIEINKKIVMELYERFITNKNNWNLLEELNRIASVYKLILSKNALTDTYTNLVNATTIDKNDEFITALITSLTKIEKTSNTDNIEQYTNIPYHLISQFFRFGLAGTVYTIILLKEKGYDIKVEQVKNSYDLLKLSIKDTNFNLLLDNTANNRLYPDIFKNIFNLEVNEDMQQEIDTYMNTQACSLKCTCIGCIEKLSPQYYFKKRIVRSYRGLDLFVTYETDHKSTLDLISNILFRNVNITSDNKIKSLIKINIPCELYYRDAYICDTKFIDTSTPTMGDKLLETAETMCRNHYINKLYVDNKTIDESKQEWFLQRGFYYSFTGSHLEKHLNIYHTMETLMLFLWMFIIYFVTLLCFNIFYYIFMI